MQKSWKKLALIALGGSVIPQCINWGEIWSDLLASSVSFTILEFLTDNNGVFDLFTDN